MEEIWKTIKDEEFSNYEISNMGNVRNKNTGKYVKGDTNNMGYRRVTFYNKPFKKRYFVHRLVAEYFVDNAQDKPIVNHIDGNKTNNIYTNLEWVTHSENDMHAFNNNLRKCNNKGIHKRVALINIDTKEILETFVSVKEASEILNIKECIIYNVLCGHKKNHNGMYFIYLD